MRRPARCGDALVYPWEAKGRPGGPQRSMLQVHQLLCLPRAGRGARLNISCAKIANRLLSFPRIWGLATRTRSPTSSSRS